MSGKAELVRVASAAAVDVLGSCPEDVLAVLLKAGSRGYDEAKLRERLLDEGLDARRAGKLAAKALDALSAASRSRKRKKFEEFPDAAGSGEANGKAAAEASAPPSAGPNSAGAPAEKAPKLDALAAAEAVDQLKVKQVMAEAQRKIEEAKNRLKLSAPAGLLPQPKPGHFFERPLMPEKMVAQPSLAPDEASKFMQQAMEKAKRRAELQAKIASRLPGAIGDVATRPKPISIDAAGRAVDVRTGEALSMAARQPTLKANQPKSEEEELVKPSPSPVDPAPEPSVSYLDPRVSQRSATRHRRMFNWGSKGQYEALANRERAKAKLDLLQSEISQASQKTGISSAVKLAMVAPKASELSQVEVPETEWWDAYLIPDGASVASVVSSLGQAEDGRLAALPQETAQLLNALVEHPIQLKPPTEPLQTQYLKVYLTKKEKRKLRRQNRREVQREQQERIRLGMAAPPEPKVKLGNLMRVLGQEAIQDPTKMEAHVRTQMAARQRKHEVANAARKLTKEQRSDKKTKKLAEDTSLGVHVAVYRVKDLSAKPANKFKLEMNAKQLQMTGVVILHKDVNVVVVEGGPKQQKFFKNLVLRRMKWDGDAPVSLVWEGLTKHRNFGEIRFKACPLEKQAREFFQKFGVPQYWDLAYNGSVLSQDTDTIL